MINFQPVECDGSRRPFKLANRRRLACESGLLRSGFLHFRA